MKVFKRSEIDSVPKIREAFETGSAVTVGNFDGVHLGHRKIISRLMETARSLKVPAIVLTFDPHPRKVLSGPDSIKLITDNRYKCGLFDSLGVDFLIMIEFTREFAAMSPSEFIDKCIVPLSPNVVIVGYDFNFGRGGAGSAETLEAAGKKLGFTVEEVAAYSPDGSTVSSSRIRNLVEAGETSMAEKFLGRPYSILGHVVRGHGRGRKIGFPTANVDTTAEIIPSDGVYAGEVAIDGELFPAMVNIGTNPTFDDIARTIEACIIDFDRDIYGKEIEVRFRERIRSEVKFSGVDALVKQIESDRKIIEEFFKKRGTSEKTFISLHCLNAL